jgi:hypothetical protein
MSMGHGLLLREDIITGVLLWRMVGVIQSFDRLLIRLWIYETGRRHLKIRRGIEALVCLPFL